MKMKAETIISSVLIIVFVLIESKIVPLASEVPLTIRLNNEQHFDQAIISWFGFSEKMYRVQYRSDLNVDDWIDLEPSLRTGGNAELSISIRFKDAKRRFYRIIELDNSITITELGMKLMPIPAGTFVMGLQSTEIDRDSDARPLTTVTITKPFWLGAAEVTQGQWQAVMANNPRSFKGDDLPVERVTWFDAVAFCERLTEQELEVGRLPEGYSFTLPTEAQWEYACRAGTQTRFYYGDDLLYSQLGRYAWHIHNGGIKTHAVGEKLPNDWGLYDMHGNVYEWCLDWYSGSYPGKNVTDPMGPGIGSRRVLRGGSFMNSGTFCTSAYRWSTFPDLWERNIGFRVALSSVP